MFKFGFDLTRCLIAAVLAAFCHSLAFAQLSNIQPTTNTKLGWVDDYATKVLGNKWDMSDSGDLAGFIKSADIGPGISNLTFSAGQFSFNVSNPDGAYFHMLSPGQCSSNPLGKNGQQFPIDSSKYRYLNIRMNSSIGSEIYLLWYTGCNYSDNFVRTTSIPTVAGWQTLSIDMQGVSVLASSNPAGSWNAAPVTGLRIDLGGVSDIAIDWISLTDAPQGDSSFSPSYSFSASGNDTRYSLFTDDNSDLSDGYHSAVIRNAASAQSVTVSSDDLFPGNYRVVGYASDDWATLMGNSWNMSSLGDIGATSAISNKAFSGGAFTATTSGDDPYFFVNNFDSTIDASVFRYLSIGMNPSAAGTGAVLWFSSSGTLMGSHYFAISAGSSVYQIDLGSLGGWSGNVGRLRFSVLTPVGTNFSFDFISLRANGYVSSLVEPTLVTSSALLVVNDPPSLKILQPDSRGGADYASKVLGNPWNFDDTADVGGAILNFSLLEILPNNYIANLQGDFLHGRSAVGSGDPYHFLLQNESSNPIDASRYKNLVYKMFVDREQDVGNGSVVRVIWHKQGDGSTTFFNGDDQMFGSVENGWEEWIQDMTEINLEALLHPPGSFTSPAWQGMVDSFRIDPHEFSEAISSYFDYARLTADDEADSQFAITYALADSDDSGADVDLDLYYTSASTATAGTLIDSVTLARNSQVYIWDASAVPAGTYRIYGVANDGYDTHTVLSSGRIVIGNGVQDVVVPILSLEKPSAGETIYDSMLVKGYALDDTQTALVEVSADSTVIGRFVPSLFNKTARTAHPNLAESSNAGFFESIDTSALASGAHTIEVRVYDTNGNQTSSGNIAVTKIDGDDPQPESAPAPENESSIEIPTASTNMIGLTAKLSTTKFELTAKITNALSAGCSSVKLYGAASKAQLEEPFASARLLKSVSTITDSLTLKAKKLPVLKPKKGGKSVYLAVACDDERESAIKTVKAATIKSSKSVNSADKWLKKVKLK